MRATQAALGAVLDLIAECGIHDVTTNAVAERAQTSKATMYRRWPSKDALIADAIGIEGLHPEAVSLYSAPRAAGAHA